MDRRCQIRTVKALRKASNGAGWRMAFGSGWGLANTTASASRADSRIMPGLPRLRKYEGFSDARKQRVTLENCLIPAIRLVDDSEESDFTAHYELENGIIWRRFFEDSLSCSTVKCIPLLSMHLNANERSATNTCN